MGLQPGTVLLHGKYRVEALLGEGGFAQVYRATHVTLRVPRALKVLWRGGPGIGSCDVADYRRRFELEAELGARLHHPRPHPHLVQVHDQEEEGEHLVLVMDYAAGGDLARRLARARAAGRRVKVLDALAMAADVAAGLAAIHAIDVVHRDLKPSNVLFAEGGRAMLGDLGLAQVSGHSVARSVVDGVPHPGTPHYMSPEQSRGSGYLGFSSDVYSLGCVLFEALTGRVYALQPPGTRVGTLRVGVPEAVDASLAEMLATDPARRPFDGEAARQALEHLRKREGLERRQPKTVVVSSPRAPAPTTSSPARGHPAWLRRPLPWLGAIAVLLVTALALWHQQAREPARASRLLPSPPTTPAPRSGEHATPAPLAEVEPRSPPPVGATTPARSPPLPKASPTAAIERPRSGARAASPSPPPSAEPSPVASLRLPIGTELLVNLATQLRSDTSRVGDEFEGWLDEAVARAPTDLPAGTRVRGRVERTGMASEPFPGPVIELSLTGILQGGRLLPIRTGNFRVYRPLQGQEADGRLIVLGAVTGAALGASIDGKSGAAQGVLVGAGAGAAAGDAPPSPVFKLGRRLAFKLARPLEVVP